MSHKQFKAFYKIGVLKTSKIMQLSFIVDSFIFHPQFAADLVTFTEEILYGKLQFLCSVDLKV